LGSFLAFFRDLLLILKDILASLGFVLQIFRISFLLFSGVVRPALERETPRRGCRSIGLSPGW
jgi:hypothetical protein